MNKAASDTGLDTAPLGAGDATGSTGASEGISSAVIDCMACGAGLESAAVCFACGGLQRGGLGKDPFALFGLPRAYSLDRGVLDALHERLTVALHPDFFVGASEEQQQLAERLSAAVNAAYDTLIDPAGRARMLLGLLADASVLDTRALPLGFLQEMFTLQESVEELSAQPRADDRAALAQEIGHRLEENRAERERLFAEGLGPEATADRWQLIQSNLNQENYLRRLWDRLND